MFLNNNNSYREKKNEGLPGCSGGQRWLQVLLRLPLTLLDRVFVLLEWAQPPTFGHSLWASLQLLEEMNHCLSDNGRLRLILLLNFKWQYVGPSMAQHQLNPRRYEHNHHHSWVIYCKVSLEHDGTEQLDDRGFLGIDFSRADMVRHVVEKWKTHLMSWSTGMVWGLLHHEAFPQDVVCLSHSCWKTSN